MYRLPYLVILGLLLQGSVYAQDPQSCFPRGVVSLPRNMGYVAREDGSVAALALQDGRVVWISRDGSLPLILVADRLVTADFSRAGSGQVAVVILDASSGATLARSDAIPLGQFGGYAPEGLPNIEATLLDRTVRLKWAIPTAYREGAAPPVQLANTPPGTREHLVTIDPMTARITQQSDVPTNSSRDNNELQYVRGSEWTNGNWSVGDKVVSLFESNSDGRYQLALRLAGNQGETTDSVMFLGPSDLISRLRVTRDGAYIIVPEADNPNPTGEWRVLSANTGGEIGRVDLDASAREICVLEPYLYYLAVTPSNNGSVSLLRAVNVTLNRTVWQYSLGKPLPGRPPRLPQ